NNPYLVRQYLMQLGERGLLRPDERGWEWELDAIAEAVIPDDLLGVMQAKLERLPAREQEVLRVAACVGPRLHIDLVEAGLRRAGSTLDRAALIAALYQLEELGLIDRIDRSGSTHRFSHDRLQEAARAELEPAERRRIHAAIAAALLERHASERRSEAVF